MSPSGNRKVEDGKSNTKSALRKTTILQEPPKSASRRPLYRSDSITKSRVGKATILASSSAMKEGSDEWIVLDAIGDTHENTNHDDEFDCIIFDNSTVKSLEPAKDTRTNKPRLLMQNWTDDEMRMSKIEHAVTKAQFRILQRKIESILRKNESLDDRESSNVEQNIEHAVTKAQFLILQRKIERILRKNESLDDRESSNVEQKKDVGPRKIWLKKRLHNRSSTLFLGDFGHSSLRIPVHGEQEENPRSTDSSAESQPWPREVRRCLGEADLRDNKDGCDNDSGEIFLGLDHIKYPDRLNLNSGFADPPKFNNCANNSGGIAHDQNKMEPKPEPSCTDIVYVQNMWTVDCEGRCGKYTGYLSCPDGVPIGKGRFEYAEKCEDERTDTGKEKPNSACGHYKGGKMVRGELFYESGYCYEGFLWCGQKHGTGKCWYHSKEHKYRQYEGNFMFDCFHGYGRMEKRDGRSYAGNWKDGKPHGRGTEFLSDGSIVYDGEWHNGETLERGCFVDDDGLPMDQMEDLSLD